MQNWKGFTLIELLIVIAIIALLASIILVSLGHARKKGADTHVITDVNQMRDLLAGTANNIYSDLKPLPGGTDPQTNVEGELNEDGPDYSKLNLLAQDASQQGGSIFYRVTTDVQGDVIAYALYGSLVSTSSAFCLDSVGGSDQNVATATIPTLTSAACPE